jgi:Flp pilus assembly protein TadD/uncharacterized protein YceK
MTHAKRHTLSAMSALGVILLMILCFGSAGCSSLYVRCTDQYQRAPHVYPATRDRAELGFPKPVAEFIDDLEDPIEYDSWLGLPCDVHPESCLFGGIAYTIGAAYWLAVDKPIAIVTDTALFPYDHHRVRQYNTVTQFWQHAFTHQGALPLPSCSEMREHNYLPYVERAFPAFLGRKNVSGPLLLQLARADVGSRLTAASRHVDADLGNLLLSRSNDLANVCVALSGNTSAPPTVLESVLDRSGEPAVLRNLAGNPNAPPHLFRALLDHTNAHPRMVERIARNTATPDAVLSGLPPQYDAAVARNPRASLATLTHIVERALPEHVDPYPPASAVSGVIGHANVSGELLAAIAERFPDRADVGSMLARHPKTPDDILRRFARMGEASVALALCENPDLPDDMVTIMAGRPALRAAHRSLARRSGLPLEAQKRLAESEDVIARSLLAANPSVDADMLSHMARNESRPEPLVTLAARTNVPETVYFAVAATTNQRALRALAYNGRVPERVLRRLLDHADDETASAILRNDRASFQTKQRALETIGTPRAYGTIGAAVLDQNEIVNGIEFMADTPIGFHHCGGVSYGTLAADRILDGRGVNSVLFRRGQTLHFDSTGKVRANPPLPTTIQGIPCSLTVRAYDSGRLRQTILAEAHTIDGIRFPAGSDVEFYESGSLKECTAPLPVDIQGVTCASYAPILFHNSGTIRSACIKEGCTVGGVTCPGGQRIHFLESGELYYTDSAQEHCRAAQRLWREGRAEQALQECERALALSPNYAGALILRGAIKRTEGDVAAALVDYEHAIDIDPGQAGAHSGAAICLHRLEKWNQAIEHFTRAIEISGRNAHTYLYRAQTWQAKREFKRARDDYNRAHELHSSYTPTVNNLAWFLATCPDDACRDGKRALSLAQDLVARQRTAPHLDTLAAAYAERGKFGKAIKTQDEAIALAEKDGFERLLPQFEERLGCYKKREAWREQ